MSNWWQRKGHKVHYPNLRQGSAPHCVYAAIAGGINHLAKKDIWTVQSLFDEYQKSGPKAAYFDVADTALARVANLVKKNHHNKQWSSDDLSPSVIRKWMEEGSVVILSMEMRKDPDSKRHGWHMFSLVAVDGDLFQVWDSNGYEGFVTDDELQNGFPYPGGDFISPHDKEDTLVLIPIVEKKA